MSGDYIVFPVDGDNKCTKGTMARGERCKKKNSLIPSKHMFLRETEKNKTNKTLTSTTQN